MSNSSVWIDFFNGQSTPRTDALDAMLGRERIVVGDLILTEVLQGFRRESDFAKAKTALESFEVRAMLGPERAVSAARAYRLLRARGVTVRKTIDVMIGAFCIDEGFVLLHDDRDFDPMVDVLGLKVWQA